jgi:cytochrome c oxidase cbb3-type subunit III
MVRTPCLISISLCAAAVLTLASPYAGVGQEPFRPVPPAGRGVPPSRQIELQPGPRVPEPEVKNPYEGDPQALKHGQQLYQAFNCAGCHFGGGGGIGPPLMGKTWIYGGRPHNIYESIAQGRPNGMPPYGHLLPEDTIWLIVAYVQSLGKAAQQEGDGRRNPSGGGGEPGARKGVERRQP